MVLIYAKIDFGVYMLRNGQLGCGVDAYYMCIYHMYAKTAYRKPTNFASYAHINCVSYARQSQFLRINTTIFLLLFSVLFLRIFMKNICYMIVFKISIFNEPLYWLDHVYIVISRG